MLRNFLLTTLRNLRKHPLYSVVNIAGLSIGIACSILILLWVHREMSYDKFHPEYDRTYQVWMHAQYTDELTSWRSVPLPLYHTLKDEHPAIESIAVSDYFAEDHLLSIGEKRINKQGHYVSEEFLSMFPFETVSGQPSTGLLDDPSSIVLTESTARALFENTDAVGKVVQLDNDTELTVTGILKDLPGHSSFQFDFLVPWKKFEQISSWVRENTDNWSNYYFQVYLTLRDPSVRGEVEASISDMLSRNGETDAERELFLLPLEEWRLESSFVNGVQSGGLIVYVRLFGGVALLILAIACINFMNLATARAERRAREVGVRKSVGSTRGQLIAQFLGESILLAALAYLIAILLVELALPYYNDMLNNKLSIDYNSMEFWVITVVVILVAGVLSGSYPAFYLSSFKPVRTLKGAIFPGRQRGILRKVLVTTQFVMSLFLLVSTVVIYQQIELVRDRELGYNVQNLIMLDYTEPMHANYEAMKRDLLASGVVSAVTKTNTAVTSVNSNNFVEWPGKPPEKNILFSTLATDYDFTETMDINVLEGRDFSRDFLSDSMAILVNKEALDVMGLKDPVGTQLRVWDDNYTLVGVIDNLLTGSVFRETKPMFVVFDPEWAEKLNIRLSGALPVDESLSRIEEVIAGYNDNYPFEYEFLDEVFESKFSLINLTQRLAGAFAILAIIITGLGLFGLATFMARRRVREMGIRKVLGASVGDLLGMMNREFIWLVVISFVISVPLTYWMLDNFLSQFDIRTGISWWVFLIAGFALMIFTTLIVSRQVHRAALLNPTVSLREE